VPSGTVTFLFTDIEGSTQRWDRDPAAMQKSVRLHDRLMREAIAAHNGYVFKTVGDAFCAAFATPESAAAAALDAQRSVAAADFSGVGGLRVRMAINTGTADERQGDYFGPAVNRVARLLSLGHGGQVLLSGVAAGMVRENAPPESTLIELGAHELKDLKGQEHVFQLAAPGLQSEFPPLRSQTTLQPWLFPEAVRTRYFTGRRDLLASVGEHLATRHRAALSGLGGVGKTQACIEYAVRHRKDYPGGVFWVNAETAGDLTRGFVEIAGALRLTDAASKDQEKIVLSVLDWLGGNDRWLLILDNVDDRREVRRFVPERGKGDILITSRESVFQELGIPRALEVRDLDDDEAMHFLLTRTGRESVEPAEAASAAELAKELGKLPLALEQAAAYVAETGASFLDYLSAYRKRRMALLERAKTLVSHDTVSVTWAANFAAVAAISPASADALRIAAFVAPDAVPFDLFSRGAKAMGGPIAEALWEADELAVAEVLRPLARYSLIRSDAKLRTFGVHRLVQEIVRSAIPETDLREFVERAVRGLNATFPEVEFDTWSTCDQLIPHVVALGSWVDAHKLASEEAARVFDLAARYLVERGRYVEAKPLLDRALWTAERALGPEHAAVGRTTHNIGTYHLFNARYVEAQRLFERALAIRERALGADHPDVASTLNGLANSFWHRGRYAEAQPLYARALAIWEGALGSDSPFVATSLNNLATVLSAQGRYAESLAMDQRALAIREHALPPGHPHIALSLNNIADDYRKLGRRAEAESLMRRSLAMRESALGPDHREVRESLNTLAAILADQGRYSEAKPIYERALAASERSLGLDNPDAAEPLAGLANLELKEGRHDEAQRLLERALSVAERGLGPEHPDLAVSLIALAHIHAIGRRYAEAEPLLERAQAIYERQFGPEHHGVAAALAGLASLRERQGRTAEAIPLLEQALAIERQTFGDEHPHVAEIGKHLEELRLREVGDAAVAES
jgi:class 3 adenylate cyclase/tetratricopeptide (TPR) repeat protein